MENKSDLDKLIDTYEEEYTQVLNSTPVLKKERPKREIDAVVNKLSMYCVNRSYCRQELAALFPLYGPGLEDFLMRAVSLSRRPLDGLVMLMGKYARGEATEDDIISFLGGEHVEVAQRSARPERPRRQISPSLKFTSFFGIIGRIGQVVGRITQRRRS